MGRAGGSANVEGGLPVPAGFSGSSGKKELTRASFFTSNQTMSANNGTVFEELGAAKVAPQEAQRWGFGQREFPDNQGYCYVDLNDINGVDENGFLRLMWKNPNASRTDMIKEFRTESLRGSQTVRDQQVLLPEQPILGIGGRDYALEDERLALDVKMDFGSQTLLATGTPSVINISTTVYFK